MARGFFFKIKMSVLSWLLCKRSYLLTSSQNTGGVHEKLTFRHTMFKEEKLKLKGTIPPLVEATDRFKPTVSAVVVRLLYKMT
jgi:hypothetical protein